MLYTVNMLNRFNAISLCQFCNAFFFFNFLASEPTSMSMLTWAGKVNV